MSVLRRRKWMVAGLALAAGTLFQFIPTGCNQYLAAEAVSAFNFCAVFNCTGGTYFNLCSPFPLLLDCPVTQTQTTT